MDIKTLLKSGFKLTALASFFFWHIAIALPENGQVAQGAATISQSQNQVVINQTSQNTVINWQNFNTASNEAVLFNQPNSSAIALNRINSGSPTTFAGQLNANGQVWILNPAGVLFTSTSKVDVAGLVATTHSITDQNFMMGNYKFDLVPGSENSKIINNGLISVKDSGIVALVAPYVENNGVIVANLGKVNLSTGASYTLDLYGDNLINFGSNAPIDNGSVSNAGQIIANGGKVYMAANSAAKVVDNVVSMSGVIEATSVSTNQNGEIILNGGGAGVTHVSGKISAPKGHIETSGHVLIIDPNAELDIAGGSWLIDPSNVTITTSATSSETLSGVNPVTFTPNGSGATVSNIQNTQINGILNGGADVTIVTANAAGTGAGDITIAAGAGITWTTANTLTLTADHNITINAAINGGTLGSVNLTASGNITQALAGVITANTLTTSSATGTALSTATNVVSNFSATNTGSGNISFNNNKSGTPGLTVTSISEQDAGTVTITNTGDITFPNAYIVNGATTFTSSAGNIVFNNSVNESVSRALTDTLSLSGTIFPTFTVTPPGGTTRLGTLSINESSAITVDATLAAFILDQLNNGTNISISSSNATGINIATPLTTSSGAASLTFLANGTGALLDINADVNTGGAQTYRASAAGGTLTLEPGVTIQGGGTISLENRNGNVSGGSNAMNIAGQIGTTAKRQPISLLLAFAPNGFDSSLNLISGATLIGSSVNISAIGPVITFPGGINWDVTGQLFARADNITSNGQIHVTGDLGTSLLPIGSIQFQAGLAVPGAGLGNSMVIFDNGVNIYTTNLTAISVRSGTQMIVNTIPNFHIPGTLSLNTWGQAGATGQVLITGAGALGTAPGQIGTIMLRGAQTYPTPSVEIDSGAQLYATNLNIDEAGTYIFLNNGTTNAYHIPGAMTVTGGNIVYVNGIIGAPGDLVGSLAVSATNNIILNTPTTGIMTSGAQTFTGPTRLNSNQTITNSTGTITFNGAVNNCPDATIGCTSGAGPFNLNVSSTSGGITFNTSIGNLAPLNNITLSSPAGTTYITVANGGTITAATLNVTASTINYGPALTVTTTGDQTYNGPGLLQTFATNNNQVTMSTTAGGSVIFNGTVSDTNPSTHGLVVTAAGGPAAGIYINANMLNLQKLILTAADKIYLNAPFIQVYGNQQGNNITMRFNSPVLLTGPTGLQTNQGSILFTSTLDGAQPFTVFTTNGQNGLNGTLDFQGAVGSITPLASFNVSVPVQFGILLLESSLNVTGNVILNVTHGLVAGTATVQLNNAVTYTIGGSLTVNSNQGTINFNGPTINTQTGMFIDAYGVLQASTTLTNGTSGNITINRSLNGDGVSPRSLTTSDTGGGSTVFNGIVGGSQPLSFIDVTGPVAINTTAVTTSGLQIYRGAATVGATTLISNSSSITFNGAVTGGTSLVATAPGNIFINGGSVVTTGLQTYNSPVILGADTTFGGGSTTGAITFNSGMDSNIPAIKRSVTLTTTAMTTLIGNILDINNLTITHNATLSTPTLHTLGNQSFGGTLTISGNSTLISDTGSITFASSVLGSVAGWDLTLTSPNAVTLNSQFDTSNFFHNLLITNASNISASAIQTTGTQTYGGAILFQSLPAITFTGTTINFNNTVNSITTSTAITITGNLTVDPVNGSIGQTFTGGSFVHVGSISVSGTTHGPNTNTSGNQTWGPVILTGDETFISTAGNIAFNSTVEGDGVSGRNMVVNAAGQVTFGTKISGGDVGNSVALASLDVTSGVATLPFTSPASGNGIYVYTTAMKTTGTQEYHTGVSEDANTTFTTTGAGNIIFDAVLSNSSTGIGATNTIINAAGNVQFNAGVGNTGLNLVGASSINVTGATGIFINSGLMFSQFGGQTYNNQITLDTNVHFQEENSTATTQFIFNGPIVPLNTGVQTLLINNLSANSNANGVLTFNAAVGTPSAQLGSVNIALQGAAITFNNNINSAGAVTINSSFVSSSGANSITFASGSTLLAGGAVTIISNNTGVNTAINFNGTLGSSGAKLSSLTVSAGSQGTGITFGATANPEVFVTGAETYTGAVNITGVTPQLQFDGSSVTFNNAVNSSSATPVVVPGNLILTANTGSMGQTNPLGSLAVTGTSSIGGNITTVNNQTYTGPVTLTHADSLISNSGNILFGNTVDGLFALTTSSLSGTTTFSNTVGATNALVSLTTSGTVDINGGSVRTSTFQNYQNAVVLGATTTLTSTGGGALSFFTIDSDSNATKRALTLTTTGLTTLRNNIGTTTAELDGLTVTNSVAIGGNIQTAHNQIYGGAAILIANDTLTSDLGNITFNSTIDNCSGLSCIFGAGPFDLTVNAPNAGEVFNGVVGGTTALNTLTLGPAIAVINANHIRTVGNQTYNGIVRVQNQTTMLFESTNLSNTFIAFGNALENGPAGADVTMSGNFKLFASGTLSVSAPVPVKSLLVTGLTYISNGSSDINTQNNQTYNGAVTFGGGGFITLETLNSGAVIHFLSTVKSDGITLTGFQLLGFGSFSPVVIFDGQVGNSNSAGDLANISELSVTASSITMNAGNVFTTDGQSYTGPMTLSRNTVLDSITANSGAISPAGITLNGTVDAAAVGGQSLQLIAVTPVTLSGNIGSIRALSALTIGTLTPTPVLTEADVNTPIITTTTSQSYYGPVVLGNDVTFHTTGSGPGTFILFNNTVSGPHNLTVDPALIIFNMPVNTTSVNATATEIDINTGSIHTTADQNYNGAVVLGADVNSLGLVAVNGNIAFSSTIDGDGVFDRALVISGNSIIFNGAVGGTNPLASLMVTAATAGHHIEFNTTLPSGILIKTVGSQTYSGDVVIDDPTDPTAINFWSTSTATVSFDNAVEGGGTSGTNAIDVTITGNFLLQGPNGNLQTGGGHVLLNSLHVTGTSTFTNPNLFNGVNVITSQTYDGPVYLDGADNVFFAVHNPGGFITFGSTLQSIGGPYSAVMVLGDPAAILTFNGVVGGVGGTNPLSSLTVIGSSAATTNINTTEINTTGLQSYGSKVILGSDATLTSTTDGITFSSTVNSDGTPRSLTLDAFLPTVLYGNIGSLPGGILSTLHIINETDINTGIVNTTTAQLYDGVVILGANVVLTSNPGGIVTFGSTIDSDINGPWDLTVNTSEARFKGNIGTSQNPMGALTVNADVINFDTAVSTVTTQGTQTYQGNIAMTIGADPLFTAPSFFISIPVVLLADATYTSTSGDIDFTKVVDGPANLFLNPASGFSAIFEADVGATTALASLIVTGDTTISGATLIRTNGDQTYSNNMVLNNSLMTTALTTGAIHFGDQSVSTSGVQTTSFDLTAVTNNAANGPTGAGITGIVRVNHFTVGGPGGANLSFNYPSSESFVQTQGAGQAVQLTTINPDFRSSGAVYCVNNFCSLIPVPPSGPTNIPPTEIFNPPEGPACDASGCANLEILVGKNNCAYSEIDLNDNVQYKKPLYRKLLLKQEQACACKEEYKWSHYCKVHKGLVNLPIEHHVAVATKSSSIKNYFDLPKLLNLNPHTVKLHQGNSKVSWEHYAVTKHDVYLR